MTYLALDKQGREWQPVLMSGVHYILLAAMALVLMGCSCLPNGSAQQGLSVQRDQPSQILSKDEIPQAGGA